MRPILSGGLVTLGQRVGRVEVLGEGAGVAVAGEGSGRARFLTVGGGRDDIFGDGSAAGGVDLDVGWVTLICLRGFC